MSIDTSFENGQTNIPGVGQQTQGSTRNRPVNGPSGVFQLSTEQARTGRNSVRVNLSSTDERGEYAFNTGVNKNYTLKWSMFLPNDIGTARAGENQYTILNQFGNLRGWLLAREGRLIVDSHNIQVRNNRTGQISTKRIGQVDERTETIVRSRGASNALVLPDLDSNSLRYTFNQYQGTDNQGRHRFSAEQFNIPIRRGAWNDFEINVRPTSDNTGFYQFSVNGQTVINERNIALVAPELPGLQFKIGPYIGDPGNGTREVFIDDVQFGENTGGIFNSPAPQSITPEPTQQDDPAPQPVIPEPTQQDDPAPQPITPEPTQQDNPVPQRTQPIAPEPTQSNPPSLPQSNDVIRGTQQKDILAGSAQDDQIIAGDGNDTILARGGNDRIEAGLGRDIIFLGPGDDTVVYRNPNEGSDSIRQFDDDIIQIDQEGFGLQSGGPIGDRFTVGSRATRSWHRFIYNENNGNFLFDPDGAGRQRATLIATIEDAPTLTRDNIQLIQGIVPEPAQQDNQSLQPQRNGIVQGTQQKDILTGSSQADQIIAGDGNDTILARGGNDRIEAGLGRDIVFLGPGDDTVVYRNPNEGADSIRQFDDDTIQIDQEGFGLRNGGPIGGRFTLGSRATRSWHRFIYNTQNGNLQFDPDGSGRQGATLIATLEDAPTLTRDNIQLI